MRGDVRLLPPPISSRKTPVRWEAFLQSNLNPLCHSTSLLGDGVHLAGQSSQMAFWLWGIWGRPLPHCPGGSCLLSQCLGMELNPHPRLSLQKDSSLSDKDLGRCQLSPSSQVC